MRRRSFFKALALLPGLTFVRPRAQLPWGERDRDPSFTTTTIQVGDVLVYGDSKGRTNAELAPLVDGQANITYQP